VHLRSDEGGAVRYPDRKRSTTCSSAPTLVTDVALRTNSVPAGHREDSKTRRLTPEVVPPHGYRVPNEPDHRASDVPIDALRRARGRDVLNMRSASWPSGGSLPQVLARRVTMVVAASREWWNKVKYEKPQRSLAARMCSQIDWTVPIHR
jgi:hypothetical protein